MVGENKKKGKGIIDQLLEKAAPVIEDRISELRVEVAEEFKQINDKLDRLLELK